VFGVLLDELINFFSSIGSHAKEIVGETLHIFSHGIAFLPKSLTDVMRSLLAHVRLEEHLQHEFAGFAASAHIKSG